MNDLDSIPVRLKKARIKAGLGLREIARRLDMSPGGYRHYETPHRFKSRYLPLELAQNIARVCGDREFARTVYDLAGGPFSGVDFDKANFGPMAMDRDELGDMDTAAFDGVRWLSDQFVEPLNRDKSNEKSGSTENFRFALSSAWLQKVTGRDALNLSMFEANSRAMEPTILKGDVVLVDEFDTDLRQDGLFALAFDGTPHVKRIGRSPRAGHVMVISDNRDHYPPVEADVGDLFPVGRVIWFGRQV